MPLPDQVVLPPDLRWAIALRILLSQSPKSEQKAQRWNSQKGTSSFKALIFWSKVHSRVRTLATLPGMKDQQESTGSMRRGSSGLVRELPGCAGQSKLDHAMHEPPRLKSRHQSLVLHKRWRRLAEPYASSNNRKNIKEIPMTAQDRARPPTQVGIEASLKSGGGCL